MSEKFDKTFWEDHYAEHAGRRHPPTPHLQELAKELHPGTALDAGCGEGADAIWLATQGWRVTAVDVSRVAIEYATQAAQEASLDHPIEWLEADLAEWTPPPGSFDLVSAQYLHVPAAARNNVLDSLADAVAPGGTLLFADHEPNEAGHSHAELAMAAVVAERLDPQRWQIDQRSASHETTGAHQHAHAVADLVLRARRIPDV